MASSVALVVSWWEEDTRVARTKGPEAAAQAQIVSVADIEVPWDPQPNVAGSSYGLIEELSAMFQLYFRYYH